MAINQSSKQNTIRTLKKASAILAGTVQPFAGDTSGWSTLNGVRQNNGWAVLEGDVLEQADYPELYAALGSTWDSFNHPADGTPTVGGSQFALPNMKGLFLGGEGANGDSTFTLGTYAADQLETHTHGWRHGSGSGATDRFVDSQSSGSILANSSTEGPDSGSYGSETRPKTAPVAYIIALYDNVANSQNLPPATATEAGTINYYQKITKELDSGFTGGELTVNIERIGDNVTISFTGQATHSSTNLISTSAGWVPDWARPPADVASIYGAGSSRVLQVSVLAGGTLRTNYLDWTGASFSSTHTGTGLLPTITYSI